MIKKINRKSVHNLAGSKLKLKLKLRYKRTFSYILDKELKMIYNKEEEIERGW